MFTFDKSQIENRIFKIQMNDQVDDEMDKKDQGENDQKVYKYLQIKRQ